MAPHRTALFPWHAQATHALQPPPLRPPPRSLAQVSKLATPVTAEPAQATGPPPRPDTHGAPLRAFAPRFHSAALGTQAASQQSQRNKCISDWKDLLAEIGTCSSTFVTALTSQSPEAAYEASLRAFTPSTLAQYFRCLRFFLAFVCALELSVGDLQLVHMVGLMQACEGSRAEDRTSVRISPRPMLKALSWLARVGQIQSLTAPLANPLVRAFASPQRNQERKEALPLPSGVLAAWERKECSADCTPSLQIALGSFLLAAHTSMRFGDIQRIKVREISFTQHALCGSCWLPKLQNWDCPGPAPFSASQAEVRNPPGCFAA